MSRHLRAILPLLAGLAAGAYLYLRPPAGEDTTSDDGLPRRVRIHEALTTPAPMRTVYLNREGAQLTGGPDDSQLNISSIVANMGLTGVELPPFAGTLSRFNAITACIREKFSAFDVEIVTRRPVVGEYIMVMMGGQVEVLGDTAKTKHNHAYGLSPYNGEPIANAVVMVFTRAMKEQTRTVCETAAMEIAHAYGLDHARECNDLMTYLPRCGGTRRFVDRAVPCGERSDRPCGNGQSAQNSHATLMQLLGAKASPETTATAR